MILRSDRRVYAAVWASAVAFYAAFIARTRFVHDGSAGFTLFDDAMISMRYARNLAEGHGLVFNAGLPPVEGYSNPLWTLWMAAVHLAGFGDRLAPLAVAISGACLVAAAAWLAGTVTREAWGSPPAARVAVALVLFNYAFAYWTLRGMEVGLVGVLSMVAVLGILRFERTTAPGHLALAAVAGAAAILTRRDAVLIALAVAGYAAVALRGTVRTRAVVAVAVAAALALGAQTAFSVWYYGDTFPNTYYLKLTGITLRDRLARGVPMLALVVVRNLAPLLVPACVPLVTGTSRARGAAALLASLVAVHMGYSAFVGGDAWEYNGHANRYIAAALPAVGVLAGVGIVQAAHRGWLRQVVSAILLVSGLRIVVELATLAFDWGPTRGHGLYLAAPGAVTVAALALSTLLAGGAAAVWRRGGVRAASFRFTCAAVLLAWGSANGAAFAAWAAGNADHARLDERWARTGLELRSRTAPDTVVAVSAAGNLPYFSRLQTLDLLGKSDPVIARMRPTGAFRPGHDKWNVEHSIGAERPDVVSDFAATAAEEAYLRDRGYEPWPARTFVLRTSVAFDHAALRVVFDHLAEEHR